LQALGPDLTPLMEATMAKVHTTVADLRACTVISAAPRSVPSPWWTSPRPPSRRA